MSVMKAMTTAMALTFGAAAFAGSAQADSWHRRHNGDAAAAGIIGFGAGALLGSALARPRYYEAAPVYVQPAPVYSYRAWSPEWYDYCADRYQSFDPRTGYFVGYDRRLHFCQ